jgi:hypothetical protein
LFKVPPDWTPASILRETVEAKEEALTNIREAITLVLGKLRSKAVGVETVEVTV